MVKKRGYLFIEFVFAFSSLCLLMNIISIMFKGLNQISLNNNQDIAYGLYSLTKEINLANQVEVSSDSITLYTQNQQSEFVLHDKYLVKKPGFNIYFHNVDYLEFSHDENYVYMYFERGDKCETFIIGVYKRPTKRICQPDSFDSISDNGINDCIDDNLIE